MSAGAIALPGAMAFSAGAAALAVLSAAGSAGLLQAAADRAATATPATRTLRIRSEVMIRLSHIVKFKA